MSDAPGDVINAYRKYLAKQPKPCIVFQGMGRGISQAELDAYPPASLGLNPRLDLSSELSSIGWSCTVA
jgi:hypothetical protein